MYHRCLSQGKKMKFWEIATKVKKTDGTPPSIGAIKEAVYTFHEEKQKVGRKKGWRKTTKSEDKVILKVFHKVRPPGHGVSARKVCEFLPRKLKAKIGKRTVIRRLAEKGYVPKKKIQKTNLGPATMKRRYNFDLANLEHKRH